MVSESKRIGQNYNPADDLAKVGKKHQIIEQEVSSPLQLLTVIFFFQIAAQVAEEIAEMERQRAQAREQRHFETTTKSTFGTQDYQQNTIGRRVMKTQDGKQVNFVERDEQLIVEHGTWRRLQKNPDQELYQRIPKGDYTQTQPVTYYTHMLERKHFQNSAAVGANPFARTSGLTQTADQTVLITVNGGSTAADFITVTLSTSKTSAVNPTLTSNKGAKAINDALTANPGGVKSKVFLPKDDAGTPLQMYVNDIAIA